MAKKTIITVATTGAWPKKENNPNVPMTPREIAEDVYDCWQAGAAIAHLHMRDDEGNGSMDTAKFRETVEILRGEHPDCDIVLNMTTSGALIKDEDLRKAHLRELRPVFCRDTCRQLRPIERRRYDSAVVLGCAGTYTAQERHQ